MRSMLFSGLVLTLLSASASADGGDIGVRVVAGSIQTILVQGEPPSQVFGTAQERVFGADLNWNPTAGRVLVDEPGYASNDTQLLGATLQFSILKSARAWNGMSFGPSTLALGTGSPDLGLPFIATPPVDQTVSGYSWIVTDDFHFEWTLNGATQSSGQGIYLAELALAGQSFGSSDPYWIVFNYGLSEVEHDLAIDWVRNNLVPAPGAAGLLVLGALCRRSRSPAPHASRSRLDS